MNHPLRYCLACDLKDDPELIEQYKAYHSPDGGWPEIAEKIKASGIRLMDIYLTGNRLFMIMEVEDSFSFEEKARLDAADERTQAWETLMDQFQQRLPWAPADVKWVQMEQIFTLP